MNLETLTVEKVLESPGEFLAYLSKSNDRKFNLTKLAEELSELSEVILKIVNKSPEKAPPLEDFIEEGGDVQIRLVIAGLMLMGSQEGLDKALDKRFKEKLTTMVQNVINNKYKNTI